MPKCEGFVSDVRPAYERATVVIAPLVASAGTNIKIMEAMAMGKAIMSTEAGIHGLELARGKDAVVADDAGDSAGGGPSTGCWTFLKSAGRWNVRLGKRRRVFMGGMRWRGSSGGCMRIYWMGSEAFVARAAKPAEPRVISAFAIED